ncbi:MAG: TonB-dependent receptor [Acidobacteria bacterium]|nr:TonB-dependent receptor [Acidobacteriota bacterium]MCK6685084.1 TonB-dependent receptor [Thermoanaerobaculia bacterium]
MRNNRLWVLLLVLPLLVATQVFAQGMGTGTISGRISDQEGQGLPGVTVTAKSPALQGSRSAVTNVNGDYLLPNLPAGDYTLNYSMPGFTAVTKTAKVPAGQTVPLSAKMAITAVAAEATVVAQSETVSQTTQASTTYSAEVTTKLPVTRNYLSTVALAPGINFNFSATAPSISGSMSFDNNMTVNGVNLQDPVRGTQTNLFIEDSIQETTTMTSGVSAEYGRFTGGVINAVTKQGGNNFSGSFRVTLNNNDWRAQPPIKASLTDEVVPTYEATLGGPIWKDRIWFFAAGRIVENKIQQSTVAPTAGSFVINQDDTRYEGKLTISPFQNHTITGAYTKQTREESNYAFTGLPLLDDPRIRYTRQLPTDVLAINYNGVITSNFFVEAQYSKKTFMFENSGGTNRDLIEGSPVLSVAQGLAQFWAPYFCADCPGAGEARDNDDYLVKGTLFLSTKSLGSHNVAFGYQNFGIQRGSNNWQSPTNFVMNSTDVINENGTLYPVIDDGSYLAYFPIPVFTKGSDIRTWSIFVNDTWKLNNNFSFNVGVRYDKNDATDSSGAKTADDSSFSPRLSATYDVKGDGSLRVMGSYSQYVGQLQETQAGAASSAGNPAYYYYYWGDIGGRPYNNPGQPLTPTATVLREMFAAYGITKIDMFPPTAPAGFVGVPGVNIQIRGGLESPYVTEYVLGIGGTVGQNLVYRVDGVRREFANFYSTKQDLTTGKVTDSEGNVYDLGIVQNSDIPEREYTGLHSSVSYRMGALNLTGNWTWSHLIGNTNGENTGGGSTRVAFETYPEYFDMKWYAPRGDLASDQRHRVRLTATYDFKLGPVTITPGMIQAFDSGTPYGAAPQGTAGVPVSVFVTNPGYVTPPSRNTYYFTARDAYRTDDIWRTDLSLNLSGKIGPVEIFVQPQVWNLFNSQGVVAVNQTVTVGTGATASATTGLKRFNPFTETPIECPQTASAAECRTLGANWKKGANFGKPTSPGAYQIPRQWYVTMGIRF